MSQIDAKNMRSLTVIYDRVGGKMFLSKIIFLNKKLE